MASPCNTSLLPFFALPRVQFGVRHWESAYICFMRTPHYTLHSLRHTNLLGSKHANAWQNRSQSLFSEYWRDGHGLVYNFDFMSSFQIIKLFFLFKGTASHHGFVRNLQIALQYIYITCLHCVSWFGVYCSYFILCLSI